MGRTSGRWQRNLRRELVVLMALKVAALVLLWWLFFSPAHRVAVDAEAASRRIGVAHAQVALAPSRSLPAQPPSAAARLSQAEPAHD